MMTMTLVQATLRKQDLKNEVRFLHTLRFDSTAKENIQDYRDMDGTGITYNDSSGTLNIGFML